MINKQLQTLLAKYPDDMPIKLVLKTSDYSQEIIDLTEENVLHTSTTAWFKEAEEDGEEDKIGLGDGQQYLLFNPIII